MDGLFIFGVTADTIFTVTVTLGTFLLGYIINRVIESRTEKTRLKEVADYFNSLIVILEKPLSYQVDSFLKFSQLLKQRKEQHFILNDVSGFQMRQISEVESRDLYRIFIKGKKGKTSDKTELYRQLRDRLEYFAIVKALTASDLREFNSKYDSYIRIYRENIKATSEQFERMLSDNMKDGIHPEHDKFLKEFDQIRFNWSQIDPVNLSYTDMYIAKTEYLDKLKDLCLRNTKDSRTVGLMKCIMECTYAIKDLDELKYVYRRHFLLFARGLQQGMIKVKEILEKFESLKSK